MKDSDRDFLSFAGDLTSQFQDRNKFLLNQSLILLVASLTVLLNEELGANFEGPWIFLLKATIVSFGISIILFSISIFNIYQVGLGIIYFTKEDLDEEKQINDIRDQMVKHMNISHQSGQIGIWGWRLGIAAGLISAGYLLVTF